MDHSAYPIVPLLQGYEWFDEALQRSLKNRGWPTLTRPESMVMHHVILGIVRPAEIARSLGLTRQAVHATIGQIVDKGVFELQPDPQDRRIRVVALTAMGAAMRADARRIVAWLAEQLGERIGRKRLANLVEALSQDWGVAPDFPWETLEGGLGPEDFRKPTDRARPSKAREASS